MNRFLLLFLFLTPQLAWSAPTKPDLQWKKHFYKWFKHAEASRPALSKEYVLIGTQNGTFYALQRQNGRVKWRYRAKVRIDSQAGTGGGKVFFGDSKGVLHALRLETGALVWKRQLDSQVRCAPRYSKDILYIQTLGNELQALDAETGKELWAYKATDFGTLPLLIASRPLLHQGVLYATFPSGIVVALEAMDGRVLWQRNLGTAELSFSALSSPVLSEQSLLVAVHGKGLISLAKNDGSLQWQFDDSQALYVTQHQGSIYLGTLAGKVHALDLRDGKSLWQQTLLQDSQVSLLGLVHFGEGVFSTDSKNSAWGLNQQKGEKFWQFNPAFDASGFASAPTVKKNSLVLWTQHGNLYYFQRH